MFPVTDSVRTRQQVCVVPRNYRVERREMKQLERACVKTALPVGTAVVPIERVVETGHLICIGRTSVSGVG